VTPECCWCAQKTLTTFCLVNPSWTRDNLVTHRCNNQSHIHISEAERFQLLENHLADLYCSKCGNPLELCPCARGRFNIIRLRRIVALHGFSCRFGEFLAYIRGTDLGRVMVAAIAMRAIESSD
jgi:hypothetical protein